MTPEPLLEAVALTKHYDRGWLRRGSPTPAVDDVTFRLRRGETLALVGESGCGKSTTARLVTRLLEPTAGAIRFEGADVTGFSGDALLQFRRQVQFVFQDPFASLNPRMRVGAILEEPLIVHGLGGKRERTERVHELLAKVGLPAEHAGRFPHEFSGGQRQRIGIARALAVGPSLIVCDEAVSALDVSIQAQVINLLADLQRELGLSYLFIAHDLAVVRHVSTRVAVMYRGRIVEIGAARTLFERPLHPYTRSLLAAIPVPDPDHVRTPVHVADNASDEGGCTFRVRCPYAIDRCSTERPMLAGAAHDVACHRAGELPEFSPATHPEYRSTGLRRRMALYRARSLSEPVLTP